MHDVVLNLEKRRKSIGLHMLTAKETRSHCLPVNLLLVKYLKSVPRQIELESFVKVCCLPIYNLSDVNIAIISLLGCK